MAGVDFEVPEEIQYFYHYDPRVRGFSELLSDYIDTIIPWSKSYRSFSETVSQASGKSTSELNDFPSDRGEGLNPEASSDGGQIAVGEICLEHYLKSNAVFAHNLYDTVKNHYKEHNDTYWSKDRLVTILHDMLNYDQNQIMGPEEISFKEYIQKTLATNAGVTPQIVEIPVEAELKNRDGLRKELNQELLSFFLEKELGSPSLERIREAQGEIASENVDPVPPFEADARYIVPRNSSKDKGDKLETEIDLAPESVDVILTSPPYWRKRRYLNETDGAEEELGWENSPEEYVDTLVETLEQWREFLRPTGSIFINIGDSFKNKSKQEIPGFFGNKVKQNDWSIRSTIVWKKPSGVPSPVSDRFAARTERIYHIVRDDVDDDPFFDREAYINLYNTGPNPDDVWVMPLDRNTGDHLAPFPRELVHRVLTSACPPQVCTKCGEPRRRITNQDRDALVETSNREDLVRHIIEYEYYKLNPRRRNAQLAIKKFLDKELTFEHVRAMQAVGISDAGKAQSIQNGLDDHEESLAELAEEAKEALGGYFREFTFPQRQTVKWSSCDCESPEYKPGRVFDPFAGSGTTLQEASKLGYEAYGADLDTSHFESEN